MIKRLNAALLLASLTFPAAPASAAINAASFVGTGTSSPGITLAQLVPFQFGGCSDQSFSADGTMILAGLSSGTYDVNMWGSTTACDETEHGTVGLSGDFTGTLHLARTEVYLTLAGWVSINGGSTSYLQLQGLWDPTSINPTQSFALVLAGQTS